MNEHTVQPGHGFSWPLAYTLPLAYATYHYGAVQPHPWHLTLAAIAALSLLPHPQPATPPALRFTLFALPAYALLQLLPLPLSTLAALAPYRAELASALTRAGIPTSAAPLTLQPSETLFQLSRLAAGILLFLAARSLAARSLAARSPARSWILALPLLAIASAQAALGLVQAFSSPDGFAHGTYVHRNHFAGLLEMALPFALAYPFAVRRRLPAALGIAAALLLLAALAHSLSRSGFAIACATAALLLPALALTQHRRRTAAALAALGIAAALLLAPAALFERFTHTLDAHGSVADMRPQVWNDTLQLIAAYPVFGSGLGTYEAALYPFRTAGLDLRMDYAHNDYLQTLAELGLAGAAILAGFLAALARECVRAVRRSGQTPLACACIAALLAIAAHSFTDFNLQIPANALVAAWIAGIASGLAAGGNHINLGGKPSCVSTI